MDFGRCTIIAQGVGHQPDFMLTQSVASESTKMFCLSILREIIIVLYPLEPDAMGIQLRREGGEEMAC